MADSTQLKERIKELTCLFRISSLDEKGLAAEEILQQSVQHILSGVQYPENCFVEIFYAGQRYRNRKPGPSCASIISKADTSQTHQIKITLEYKVSEDLSEEVLLFLPEEKGMLDAACKQLASKLNWLEVNSELELQRLTQNRSYLNANIGSWQIDFEKNRVYFSEVLATLLEADNKFRFTPNDLLKYVAEEKDKERLKSRVKEAIKLQESFNIELNLQSVHGKNIWVKIVGEPRFEEGKCINLFGTVQNIQRRKKIEKALSQRNQFIETALENLPVGIAIHTISDGKVQFMNRKFSEIYGWSEDKITEVDTFFKKVYPDDNYRNRISNRILEDMKSGNPDKMSWKGIQIFQESGAKRIINAKNIPVFDQDLMISTVTDVTKKFRAEEKLKANERRFKALVQDGSDLIAILDLNGEFTYVSPTSILVLGMEPERAIGNKMIDFVHRDDQAMIVDIMNNLPQRRRFVVKQVRFRSGDNKYKWLEASVTNMLHEPSVSGFVINAHDITERINHQNEMKNALAEKEVLLSEIHHRVKNNLAVVSGMMQLQLYEESDPNVQYKLQDSMLRIQTMVNIHELLYNTKSFAKLSFGDVIQKLGENVTLAMSGNKKVDLNIDSDPVVLNINQAIPCSLIINEVLTNIFKHAFKGRKAGKVNISIHQNGSKVELKIEDDGVGLSKDFNLDDGRTLGKNIIKILSEQLDADIKFYNNGSGTSFELQFEPRNISPKNQSRYKE